MSGSNLLLDTNIVLYLLGGDETIAETLNGKNIYVSFITELELLGYPDQSDSEKRLIQELLDDVAIISLNENIKKEVIEIRTKYRVKLPDAIIAATAIYLNMPLFSADKGFLKIEDLNLLHFEL